jgi:hypothetical protein
MAGLNGDSGANPDGGARGENGAFEGEKVIAEIFAGVGDDGGAGGWIQKLYTQHYSDGNGAGKRPGHHLTVIFEIPGLLSAQKCHQSNQEMPDASPTYA